MTRSYWDKKPYLSSLSKSGPKSSYTYKTPQEEFNNGKKLEVKYL